MGGAWVLSGAGLLDRWKPSRAIVHWEIRDITPADVLAGRSTAIWADRDRKLEADREARRVRRAASYQEAA
jgi:hypothetical protein